jgi:hypothetical protein
MVDYQPLDNHPEERFQTPQGWIPPEPPLISEKLYEGLTNDVFDRDAIKNIWGPARHKTGAADELLIDEAPIYPLDWI